MFRDKEEELQRLQQELLAQEEPEEAQTEADADLLDDAALDALLKDTRPAEDRVIYQNFSNDYGQGLRNFASGYKAYNADKLDTDVEEISQQVLEPKRNTGLLITAALLTAAILAVVCWILLRYGGIL